MVPSDLESEKKEGIPNNFCHLLFGGEAALESVKNGYLKVQSVAFSSFEEPITVVKYERDS